MPLNGQQLDEVFGSGFSPVKSITGFNSAALNRPSTPIPNPDVDVTEQQHRVSIEFVAATGALRIAPSAAGEGLWIPWLGNGTGEQNAKGWGTYSKPILNSSWVATGPFSGCFVARFAGGAGPRFAHLITPAAGHRAATVNQQIAAIKFATGYVHHDRWPMNGAGLGLAFFMRIRGGWHRRFAWVGPGGNLMQLNARSTPI